MKFLRYFFILCCLFSNASSAQELTGDASSAIQKIVTGSGPLTKEEYDGFWNGIGIKTEAEKLRIIDSMKDNFMIMQSYQQAIWVCAEKSWISRKKDSCKSAKNIIAKMKRKRIKNQEQMIDSLEKSMDSLLESAAKRGQYAADGSQVGMSLTLEVIRATKDNTTAMLNRFEKVLSVKYSK